MRERPTEEKLSGGGCEEQQSEKPKRTHKRVSYRFREDSGH